LTGTVCTPPAKPAVTIAAVQQRLVRLVPGSALGLAPQHVTLVNMQTVIWVEAPPVRTLGPLAILGHRVSVTLAFDHVRYDYGDGATDDAAGPGRPYDRAADLCKTRMCPGYDGHVYADTGHVTVTATVSWTVRFTVDGGSAINIPGTVTGPTASAPLTINQARGVLVADP
jgi:hypothetical protein